MDTPDSTTTHTYQRSGVDIDKAEHLLSGQKQTIDAATRPEVLSKTGAFGGLFNLDTAQYHDPVLVSSMDGVGTKLMVATMADRHENIGYDLVHHCINDIIVQGAEPLYFMDYLGTGTLDEHVYQELIRGLADACSSHNMALLGGETAEMPGMYGEHYDLVGCITGVVERANIITGEKVKAGDKLVALPSNGLHTNGYSLARQVFFSDCGYTHETELPELNTNIGEALLRPHRCYWPSFRRARANGIRIRAAAHITGGGIYGNIPRVLPEGLGVIYDPSAAPVPPIFEVIAEKGDISRREMYKVFNMGVGMIWILPPEDIASATAAGQPPEDIPIVVGEVVKTNSQVVKIQGIDG